MLTLLLLQAPVTLDLGSWVSTAVNNMMTMINQAGPFIFGLLATVAGVGLVMKLVQRVTN